MRIPVSLCCLALCLGFLTRAAGSDSPLVVRNPGAGAADKNPAAGPSGGACIVGLSPFLDPAVKDTVYRVLVRLIVEDLPLGARIEVYDAYNLRTITRVSVPGSKVFSSPKTRANQFASRITELKQFLARANPEPGGSRPGSNGLVRLPQFCDFLARDRTPDAGSARPSLLLIGSPLYQDAKEPGFSMLDGYFPSDGHLRATREQSVFGFNPVDGSSPAPQVSWAWFGDPWVSDLHREKVARFWTLYLERRGGRLASFSADLATAFGSFNSGGPGPAAASNGWVADPSQTRLEMLRAGRGVNLVDWLTGDAPEISPPPARMTGPLKIGIRWRENIDLDLYAAPRPGAETVFFQHPRSPEGSYYKDQRSSPGREYEFIEFESPVDVREARAFVNFYEGSCPGGPRGEVRVEYLNRIYSGAFAIPAPGGNQGRNGPAQADYWTQIPLQKILGLSEASTAAAAR